MDLGFAESCPQIWRLYSQYFPSKLGGAPAWLSFDCLPGYEELKCHGCQTTSKFLLQLYSPGSEEEDDCDETVSQTFHRSLFMFVCAKESCNSRAIKCFRSQLPRTNPYYSYKPPNYDTFDPSFSPKRPLSGKVCHVCSCKATKLCGECKLYSYCSKAHQALHWKTDHKNKCANPPQGSDDTLGSYFFKEYEIVMDVEDISDRKPKSEEEALAEYKRYLAQKSEGKRESSSDWEAAGEVQVADKMFMAFRERIADNPDQIVRYEKGGKPLLVSDEGKPPLDIPACNSCGGEREFEFQVMSQCLSYLNVDTSVNSLDWGTLIIYTCKKSCQIQGYAPEYVWKQDFSNKDLVAGK
ncbi:programmed cell death protein 2-like isoform X2 [Watersipora subatra]|uniref:programmed cell death protein 2-like isoform X2 n=1 Tax=Watersipora subatra TaxID=2589382 RepID=UPI00355B9C92